MRIGSVAHEAGVGVDTVRYHERDGLLPPVLREASGYRRFDRSVLEERLDELTRIRDGLRTLVLERPGHGAIDTWPILDALAGRRS